MAHALGLIKQNDLTPGDCVSIDQHWENKLSRSIVALGKDAFALVSSQSLSEITLDIAVCLTWRFDGGAKSKVGRLISQFQEFAKVSSK